MIDRKPPELFAEPPVRSDFMRYRRPPMRGRRRLMLLALLIGIVGGLLAFWKFGSHDDQTPAEIPTIKAEGPLKQRPEQPGGIDIPHQDEMVFQQLDNSASGKQPAVEHLLPPPEVPQTEQPLAAAVSSPATLQTATTTSTTAAQTAPAPAAAPVASVVSATSTLQTATTATQTPAKPGSQVEKLEAPSALISTATETTSPAAAATAAAQATPPNGKTAAKPPVTGHLPSDMFTGDASKGFLVQMGSFPEQTKAQSEMAKLQKKYADTLGGVKLHLTRVDLGSKGIYYRVQSESLSDAQARSICATLWGQKAPCIIVRP